NGQFIEIFVDTPVTVCQSRDPKGLYKKAREGKITDMTGIQAPYEAPEDPDIHIHTESQSPDESIAEILTELQKRNVLE
ncbi:MAG: adenylyl-sulfate kinase, partial [Leptospiraceae bacterium]|nr:adenylyl-sulfate kinase [Leptospiraceae bacterium]